MKESIRIVEAESFVYDFSQIMDGYDDDCQIVDHSTGMELIQLKNEYKELIDDINKQAEEGDDM